MLFVFVVKVVTAKVRASLQQSSGACGSRMGPSSDASCSVAAAAAAADAGFHHGTDGGMLDSLLVGELRIGRHRVEIAGVTDDQARRRWSHGDCSLSALTIQRLHKKVKFPYSTISRDCSGVYGTRLMLLRGEPMLAMLRAMSWNTSCKQWRSYNFARRICGHRCHRKQRIVC